MTAPRQRAKSEERPHNHNPAAVREARVARGMTQAELAEKLGLSHNYICGIESGARNARPELLQNIAAALGASYELLASARTWSDCPACGHRYEPGSDARIPLHLRDDGDFCTVNLVTVEAV